jgi:hypothetical protein
LLASVDTFFFLTRHFSARAKNACFNGGSQAQCTLDEFPQAQCALDEFPQAQCALDEFAQLLSTRKEAA